MEVRIFKGGSGCRSASGVAVVIDVFRATTTLCCLLQAKPRRLLVGATHDLIPDLTSTGDLEYFTEIQRPFRTQDNSPLAALSVPLRDKTAILVSRNGTVAINAARHCDRVLAGAFVNADALVEYLSVLNPEVVSLIAVGRISRLEEAEEDNACAEFLRARLSGAPVDEHEIRCRLRRCISQRRLDPEIPQGPAVEVDLMIASGIGTIDVVPEISFEDRWISVFDPRSGER